MVYESLVGHVRFMRLYTVTSVYSSDHEFLEGTEVPEDLLLVKKSVR